MNIKIKRNKVFLRKIREIFSGKLRKIREIFSGKLRKIREIFSGKLRKIREIFVLFQQLRNTLVQSLLQACGAES